VATSGDTSVLCRLQHHFLSAAVMMKALSNMEHVLCAVPARCACTCALP
jgi:hypothetical protein